MVLLPNRVWMCLCVSYLVDPAVESRNSGEDGGLLHVVATEARDEAGNAMNLPGTIGVLTVQRATGIALVKESKEEGLCFILLVESLVDWQESLNHENQNHCFTTYHVVKRHIFFHFSW